MPPTTSTVTPTTVSCPTSAVASTLVGHQTGNGNIVWISPNESSSHFTHGDTVRVTFTLASGETCTATVATPTVATPTVTTVVNEVEAAVEQALGTSVVSTTTTPPNGAGVAAAASSNAPAAGGVAGVQATHTSGGGAGGVLGAFGVLGQAAGGTLPFTGFPLWLAVVIAIALIAIGWTLSHRGRPAATRDVV